MVSNYYIAKLDISHCLVDIRINDVPLIKQYVDSDVTAEFPINYLIESTGNQTLEIKIYPLLNEIKFCHSTRCNVEIWRYDASCSKISPIEKVCSSNLAVSGDANVQTFMYDIKTFIANVSYEITRWSCCEEIKDIKRIAPLVAEFYQTIGLLLANKQYDNYTEYIKERELNICKSLMLGNDEICIRNEMLFECLDSGFVIQPLKGGKQMQLYANNRVVTVLDSDMKSALRFVNEETGEMLTIELLLGIKKGESKFSII